MLRCIAALIRARIKAERVTPRQPAFLISCNLVSIQSVSSSVNHTAVWRVFASGLPMPCAGMGACPVVLKTLSLVMLRLGLVMNDLLCYGPVCPSPLDVRCDIKHGGTLPRRFCKPHAFVDGVLENMTRPSHLRFRLVDHLAGMHSPGEAGWNNPQ